MENIVSDNNQIENIRIKNYINNLSVEKKALLEKNYIIDQNFKNKFNEERQLYSIDIDKKDTNKFVSHFKNYMFRYKMFNPIINKNNELNTIVLNYSIKDNNNLKEFITNKLSNISINYKEPNIININLGYNNFNIEDCLKKLFNEEIVKEMPKSYEVIGCIAHLNIRDNYLPFRYLIGSLILDKNQTIKTVINKTSKIDNVYRTYKIELLAGIDSYLTTQKEGNCKFTFDIRNVYWCSKLAMERDRLLKILKPNSILCDAFCGVGPLAIRAAKQKVNVLANDLNPECYSALLNNKKDNKIDNNKLKCFNMDAREFIKLCIKRSDKILESNINIDNIFSEDEDDVNTNQLEKSNNNYNKEIKNNTCFNSKNKSVFKYKFKIDHIYMNLPMDALEFLDVFKGLFKNSDKDIYNKNSLPTVHVYCFSKDLNYDDIIKRAGKALGYNNFGKNKSDYLIHNIRDVSPRKYMFCLSFVIPENVAFFNE